MPSIPNSFTNIFGGETVQPAQVSYASFTMPPNLQFSWPVVGLQTDTVIPLFADLNQGATIGSTVTMPDATQVSVGQTVIFRNLGSTVIAVYNFLGVEIVTIPPASGLQTNCVYLIVIDNSTQGGLWGNVAFGATSGAVQASDLVGNGLIVLSNRLNFNVPISHFSSASYVSTFADRGKFFVYGGGIGTFTLPDANALPNGFIVSVANRSTIGGQVTVATQGGQTIDGEPFLILSLDQDCSFITDGFNWTSFGLGILTFFLVNVSRIILNNDATITVSTTDATKQVQIFSGVQNADTLVTYPNIAAVYYIFNATNVSAFSVNVKVAGGSLITAIPNGERFIFISDGIEMQSVPSSLVSSVFPDGSVAAPSITFADALGDGFYLPAPNRVGVAINSTEMVEFTTKGLEVVANGSAANPSLYFKNANGGFYWDTVVGSIKLAYAAADKYSFSPTQALMQPGNTARPGVSFANDNTKGIAGDGLDTISIVTSGNTLLTVGAADIDVLLGTPLRFWNVADTFYTAIEAGAVAADTTYTLPLAYPVGTGYVLASTTGGAMSWVPNAATLVSLDDGTAGAPSLFFTTHPTTGIYEPAADTIGFTTAGVERAFISSAGLEVVSGQIISVDGTAAVPSFAFVGDLNTGMYRSAAGVIGFTSAGVETLSIDAAGVGTIDGTAGLPSYTFLSDVTTGMYKAGVGTLGFSAAGAQIANISSAGLTIAATKALSLTNPANTFTTSLTSGAVTGNTPYTLPIGYPALSGQALVSTTAGVMGWSTSNFNANGLTVPVGAVGTPSLNFIGSLTTGIFSNIPGEINFSSAGVDIVTINSNGIITGAGTVVGFYDPADAFSSSFAQPTGLASNWEYLWPTNTPDAITNKHLTVASVVGTVVTLTWAP